jgi:hypothetical protein
VGADATRLVRDAAGRPAGEHDRHGTRLSELEWHTDGDLHRARVRTPGGDWLAIEPRAGAPGPWGLSDVIARDGQPLTRMTAVDWRRIERLPVVAEPARLPAGAGTALFNLLARLALEQGVELLRYDAPYPTEALLLALLESFRYVPSDTPDPRAAFTDGTLAWTPAPHEVAIEADVWVQRRDRIEKVVADGRAYYRADWQGVRRLAPRVVRDERDTVRASLVVLGRVIEDHVVLGADGRVLARPTPPADPAEVTPLGADVVSGLVATLLATSAPPLAPWLDAAARGVAFVWGPVDADLVAMIGNRVTLSHRLRRALAELIRGRGRADALGAALALLREMADLVGDGLRARAQAALAAEPAHVQARAVESTALPVADARAIAAAAAALAADAARA